MINWILYALGVLCIATVPAGNGHIDASMGIIGAALLLAALVRLIHGS